MFFYPPRCVVSIEQDDDLGFDSGDSGDEEGGGGYGNGNGNRNRLKKVLHQWGEENKQSGMNRSFFSCFMQARRECWVCARMRKAQEKRQIASPP